MTVSPDSLLIVLIVGLIAGWLASRIVRGAGYGIIGDIIIGILGAFIGSWLLAELGVGIGGDIVSEIIAATIGAVLLLLLLRAIRRRRRW